MSLEERFLDTITSISPRTGERIRSMLIWENERLSDETVAEKLNKINCHKTVLYLADVISEDEFLSDPKTSNVADFTFAEKALTLSDKEFVSIKTDGELRSLAASCCANGHICIGQIFTEDLGHSFIVVKADDDTFACFDKAGFRENPAKDNYDYKFRVYELGNLLQSPKWRDAKWRFFPMPTK